MAKKKKTEKVEDKILGYIVLDIDTVEPGPPSFIESDDLMNFIQDAKEGYGSHLDITTLGDLFKDRIFALMESKKMLPIEVNIDLIPEVTISLIEE